MNQPDPTKLPPALRTLHETLEAEREALIANDADAIVRLAEAKLKNLRTLEAAPVGPALKNFDAELRALAALNVANGALIARRRQETVWTLQQLGLFQQESVYDERGGYGAAIKSRHRSLA